jgi:hypothetical protein
VEELRQRSGNDLVLAVFEQREELARRYVEWKAAAARATARLPHWRRFEQLLTHAEELPVHAGSAAQAQAIRNGRSLLAEPDPVPPLAREVTDALRLAIREACDCYLEEHRARLDALEADATWKQLSEEDQKAIRLQEGMQPLASPALGTEQEVLAALEATPLTAWRSRTDALAEQSHRALLAAARRLEPEAVRVKLPPANLATVAQVDEYLDGVRAMILEYVAAGRPVVV